MKTDVSYGEEFVSEVKISALCDAAMRFETWAERVLHSAERKVILMIVKEENQKLTLRQREGRAKNAVAELLRRKLSVPNIYLEPPASLISADVLAVDHGGAGDLHAVEIKLESILISPRDNRGSHPTLMNLMS